jgi:hypothetical protein
MLLILVLIGLAWTFMKLGAATVLVKVLAVALSMAIGLLTVLGVWWLGRKLFSR